MHLFLKAQIHEINHIGDKSRFQAHFFFYLKMVPFDQGLLREERKNTKHKK